MLTHNYTGYPMVRQARQMVAEGRIGAIRVVQVEYAQDWLTEDQQGNKQADWRTDPARSGTGGSTGDIGTHAFNLAQFVTGLELDSLCADLQAFVPARRLDDNAHVMLRYKGGAKGMLWCSQVAPGNENALRLRVYGDKGGLEWAQENPNQLWFTPFGQPKQLITRGGAGTTADAARVSARAAGPSRGLSGRLRQYLCRGRPRDPRPPQRRGCSCGCGVSGPGRGSCRDAVHRRLRAVLRPQRGLGLASLIWGLTRLRTGT